MFPYALPFGYCPLVRLPLFCREDHHFHFPPTELLPGLSQTSGSPAAETHPATPPPAKDRTTATGMIAHPKGAEHRSETSTPQQKKLPVPNKRKL